MVRIRHRRGKKRCSRCRGWRALASYSKNRRRVDGLNPHCKPCVRAYYVRNRKRTLRRVARYQRRNAKRYRAYLRSYYRRNRVRWSAIAKTPKRRAYMRLYLRAYYLANADRLRRAARALYRKHPSRYRAYGATRRARLAAVPGRFTATDIVQLHRRQRGRCLYCGDRLGDRYQVDHKIPLARPELKPTNWPTNLALACEPCNKSKRTRTAEEFLAIRRAA